MTAQRPLSRPSQQKATHLQHDRGSGAKDALCGTWWPKNVTTNIDDVTCKKCLRYHVVKKGKK